MNKGISIVDNAFLLVGKIIVVMGGLFGFFQLLSFIVTSLEPSVNRAFKFCMENIQVISIGVFCFMCLFVVVVKAIERKRALQPSKRIIEEGCNEAPIEG